MACAKSLKPYLVPGAAKGVSIAQLVDATGVQDPNDVATRYCNQSIGECCLSGTRAAFATIADGILVMDLPFRGNAKLSRSNLFR